MYYARDALNCVEARRIIRKCDKILRSNQHADIADDVYLIKRAQQSRLGLCTLAIMGYGPLAFY